MSPSDATQDQDRHSVLLVGGIDPSGGAGLLTDAMTVTVLGLHPVLATTAIAVQNTDRVARRYDLPASLLREQLNVVSEEFALGAVKSGMLPTTEIVETLDEWLSMRPRLPLVLDPVLRATSGGDLVDKTAIETMVRRLFRRARVMTPNLEEAALLSGQTIRDKDDIPRIAKLLLELGPEWVLVKGGHSRDDNASDYLVSKDGGSWLVETRRAEAETRGTGCALASAIASGLARGDAVPDAVRSAKAFVTQALDLGYRAGKGRFLNPQS